MNEAANDLPGWDEHGQARLGLLPCVAAAACHATEDAAPPSSPLQVLLEADRLVHAPPGSCCGASYTYARAQPCSIALLPSDTNTSSMLRM